MAFLSTPKNRLSVLIKAGLVLLASLGALKNAPAATLPLDGFQPNANSTVNAVALQPDGKIVVGGYFTQFQPTGSTAVPAAYIARLNHDGSVDTSFSPGTDGVVRSVLVQANGQIVIAGEFLNVRGTGSATLVPHSYIARLNADGTLDSTFNPTADKIVYALAAQADGSLLIGGSFDTIGTTTRNHIARLNADGSLDTSFNPNADKPVLSLAVESNGQIVVGGGFSKLQPNGASSATTRNCLARLNADGSLDTSFDPEPNGSVMAILLLPNGQIVVGGQFTTLQPNGASSTTQADFLARVNADGTLDSTFIVNPLEYVDALALQPDGKVIFGGIFTQIFPSTSLTATAVSYLARVNPNGTLDGTFIPQPNQAVNAIAVQPDGNVIAAGYFTSLQPLDTTLPLQRGYIARLTTFGVPDSTLAPDAAGTVLASVPLANGQVLIGGTFLSVGGATRSYLARLNADGTVDSTFNPSVNGPVQTLAVEGDGKYLVGGSFNIVDGIGRNYIARLNTDGTLDGAFNPNPNSSISLIYVLSNQTMLISGGFNYLTPNGSATAYQISELALINADGSVDIAFNPAPDGTVFAVAAQADGKLILGGGFTTINGLTRSYIARINPDGTADTATNFDPEANAPIYSIVVQADNKILVGGDFTTFVPQTGKAGGTPVVTTLPNGLTQTIPQAGYNATALIQANHMARLLADGEVDSTFMPDPSSDVTSMALQANGQILIGGIFTSLAPNGGITGTVRNHVARLNADGSIDSGFNPNANDLVNTLSLLTSGQVLIGGSFTTLQPNGSATAINASHVAVLNTDGSDNTAFTAGSGVTAGGAVTSLVIQPNGQFLVGGSFSPLGGTPGSYLARFNADATPDASYNANVNGPVHAISVVPRGATTQTPSNSGVWLEPTGIVRHAYTASTNGEIDASAIQSDGRIIIGGLFSDFDGIAGLQNLVRLNLDGSVDTTFNPNPGGIVSSIAIQANGQIVIGGAFTNVGTVNTAYLARLNADGSLDTTFTPTPNGQVLSVAIQPSDGKIIAAGDFTTETPNGATSVSENAYIARFNTDGSIDSSFAPDPSSPVYAVAVIPSASPNAANKIIIGGAFTSLSPNQGSTPYPAVDLARLNTDGSVDTSFYPDPNEPITAILCQPDGNIVVSGSFSAFTQNAYSYTTTNGTTTLTTSTTVVPVDVRFVARIKTDGSVDTTFNPNPNAAVTTLALQSNGDIILGGAFSNLQPNETGFVANRYNIARVTTTGLLDPSFDPGLNGTVDTITLLNDGSLFVGGDFNEIQVGGAILIGGSFSSIQSNAATNLGRLNSDGTFDSSFLAHPDGPVYALTPQPNGQTLVGGAFATIESKPEANLARLNLDSSVDATFSASTNGPVQSITVRPDGGVLVGGNFTSVSGQALPYFALLSAAGAPQTAYTPAVNGPVNAAVLQPNGQVVIGGAFTSVGGLAVGGIARLNADGTVDATFNPNANGTVDSLSLQVDGGLYVTGAFTTIGGQAIPYAAHLLSSGAVDPAFVPAPNGVVDAVSVQADGKVLLGGNFTSAGGQIRLDLARYASPTPVTQTVGSSSNESTLTWTRTGNAPAFASVLFEESTDNNTWTTVGNGTTTDGQTWEISGLASTGSTIFYVRATGVIPASQFSSSGLEQVVAMEDATATSTVNSASVATGSSGTPFNFTVTATQSPKTFAASGLPAGLTINPTTGVISGTPVGSGSYDVVVTVGNAGGTTVSTLVISIGSASSTRFSPASTSAANRLLNLSSRAQLSSTQVLISGFVITGSGAKPLVIRAVGPGLTPFGVPNVMATPELQIYNSAGTIISDTKAWGGSASVAAAFAQVGAFALSPTSADAAVLESLQPGSYTIHVFDAAAKGGIVLAEIYDASPGPLTAAQRLINISTRGTVSPGAGALIGGFVITGSTTKSVLIRGIGPGLSAFGVTDSISDPVLSVYDENGNLVAHNAAWTTQVSAGVDQPVITADDITNNDGAVGAFALTSLSPDTAVIANLPPGAYTFEVTSASAATGEALGEVYELP
jgi:uncharacterized delta-60 repeat protein